MPSPPTFLVYRKLLIFFAIICICLPALVLAQVTIRERVEINVNTPANTLAKKANSILAGNDVVSGFIMPKSGSLQVYYTFCSRLDRMLPMDAALMARFLKGDSTKTDLLSSRFPDITPWPRYI